MNDHKIGVNRKCLNPYFSNKPNVVTIYKNLLSFTILKNGHNLGSHRESLKWNRKIFL